MKSYINITEVAQFLTANNLETIEQHGLIIKENNDLGLYLMALPKENETELTDFQRQANGLIFEKETNRLVCASQTIFRDITAKTLMEKINKKVLNNIPEKVRLEYCEDGTMIRLYNYNDVWCTSTTRCIDARKSFWSSEKTFDEMFWEIFDNSHLERLDKTCTYIFILLHKENRIVIKHYQNALIFISKIKNEPVNGMLEEDFSNIFYTPNNFTIKRPKMISELNLEDFDNKGAERKRGVLVKFFEGTEWNVYKIDFEEYIVLKELRGNVPDIKMRYLELLNDPEKLNKFVKNYSEHFHEFEKLKKTLLNLCKKIHKLYIESHIKHATKITDDHIFYRTLRQLHGQYKKTEKPISFEDVQTKLYSLDRPILYKFITQN